jgi:hypothetical protein
MKKTICIAILSCAVLIASCTKDYSRAILGTWDAGKASLESRIVVTIRDNGLLTAAITNTDMKPINGTYEIKNDVLVIKLSSTTLSYKIVKLDDSRLVMSSESAKITWIKIE